MTSVTAPEKAIVPSATKIPLVQRAFTAATLWLTNKIVRPSRETSLILPRHFFWKAASPTARTSSTKQNFGLEVGGDCEGEAHLHAAAVVLQGGVEEAFHFGEGYDLVELAADFCGAHAEDGAAHEDIFASGELGVETGADFEKAADAAVKLGVSFGGAGDARQDFQQRAFAGAVAADQAHHFAFFYVEGDVLQRPDVGRAAAVLV